MTKFSVGLAWAYLNHYFFRRAYRYLLALLPLLISDTCFGWRVSFNDLVAQGSLVVRCPAGSVPTPGNTELVVNRNNANLFSMTRQEELFIGQTLITAAWIQAWFTHGIELTSGMVVAPIFPQMAQPLLAVAAPPPMAMSMPVNVQVNVQGVPMIPLYDHQQCMFEATQNQEVLAQQVDSLFAQITVLQQQSGHQQQSGQMISQTQHQLSLRKNIDAYAKQLKEKDKEITELNQKIESLNPSLQGATTFVDTGSNTEVTEETNYEELLAEKDEEIKKKKEELARLQQALKDKEAELEQQSQEASKQKEKAEGLKCERDKAKKAAENAEEETKQAKQKNDKLRSQLSTLGAKQKSEFEKKEKEADSLKKKADSLKKELDDKASELKGKVQENQKLKGKLKAKNEEITRKNKKEKERLEKEKRTSIERPLYQVTGNKGPQLQQKIMVSSVGVQCGDGSPDMAGDIDIGSFNPSPEQPSGSGDNKGQHQSPAENHGQPGKTPSAVNGAVAETIKLVFQVAPPYLFPVAIASFVSGVIAYRLGLDNSKGGRENPEANQGSRTNNRETTSTPVIAVQTMPVDTGCDWLGADNKLRPLCLQLLEAPDADTVQLLVLLNNISSRFPDTLMYPVFSWGYWTESGSSSLNFNELLKRIESSSLAQPFVVGNLYLRTLKVKDFYQETVRKQAQTLRWLLSQWQRKPHIIWEDFSMVHSPQEIKKFPVLLGAAMLGSALEGKHKKLLQQLERRGVKYLVPKLLTLVLKPGEMEISPTAESSLTLFDLGDDKPVPIWEEMQEVSIENGKESGLVAGCTGMVISDLKRDCLGYIMTGAIWKAKIIGALNKYVTGSLPVFDFNGEGDIRAEYPQISELQRITTMHFLLDWIDVYHSDAGNTEKVRFIRAALTLVGIYNDASQANYEWALGTVWNLQKEKTLWTDRVWSERLLKMKRTADGKPELTFIPVWRLHYFKMSLMLIPDVPEEELPGQLEGRTKFIPLPRIGKEEVYLYRWSRKKERWDGLVYKDEKEGRRKVMQGEKVNIFCGSVYGMGSSETQVDFYFAYNNNCKLRKTHFASHVKLPE